jgi:peptide-methionine (S)-S-oxide reductase
MENTQNIKQASFGAGCFWCVETIFSELQGVVSVEPGYMGGHTKNPTYEEVCTGETGHAEVVHLNYDSDLISYEEILEVFWKVHDPTTLNRQGGDIGTQYRSVIFYYDENQRKIAEDLKKSLNEDKVYDNDVVTEISKVEMFYKAENYHKDYYNNNRFKGYCTMVIKPKLDKFRKVFKEKLKTDK